MSEKPNSAWPRLLAKANEFGPASCKTRKRTGLTHPRAPAATNHLFPLPAAYLDPRHREDGCCDERRDIRHRHVEGRVERDEQQGQIEQREGDAD